MSASIGLAKCSCRHCGGHLEFETACVGERVACPHCGNETRLYIQDSPEEQSTPSSPSGGYRLEEVTGRRAWKPPRRSIDPVAFIRAAKTSWVAFLFAYGFSSVFDRGPRGDHTLIIGVTVVVFVLIGFACGIFALCGIRKCGARGVLIPGVVGVILNGLYLVVLVAGSGK